MGRAERATVGARRSCPSLGGGVGDLRIIGEQQQRQVTRLHAGGCSALAVLVLLVPVLLQDCMASAKCTGIALPMLHVLLFLLGAQA